MTIEELKVAIEQGTGVQASLLTGETSEEVIAQAKAFLAFKREREDQRPKSTAEQFGSWFNAVQGIEEPDEAGAALAGIQEAVRVAEGGYPKVPDGGEPMLGDQRSAKEKFSEWFWNVSAFDPFNDHTGWK